MPNIPNFFKMPQKKSINHNVSTSINMHVEFRADFAVALWLVDYLRRTTTHQKNLCVTEIILEPLLEKLQAVKAFKKPSVGYLTPIKYLKQLCLDTDLNLLVPALVDVLNQITLNHILKNSRAYTSYFLNISPHTLSENNIRSNPQCLNPLLPSIILQRTNLPFYITTTSGKKTLPKKHPQSTPLLPTSTGIKLDWQNGHCLASTDIIDDNYFKNFDTTNPPPTSPLCLENLEHYIKHLKQETTRSNDVYHVTRNKLVKYMSAEKKTDGDLLGVYFDFLNKSFKQPSKYFDTLHGTQAFFMQAAVSDSPDDLKGTITRLLTLGESLDMTTTPNKVSALSASTPIG
ncbi:MAG: hypothetical protein P1U39_06425 [Legionellaceae bacterium]|nr:hypothetical protein [Legionellaceae bacterium]